MTPNPPQASLQNSRRGLHRVRNVVLLSGLALLAVAGTATAQLPALPALPGVNHGITTPLGTAHAGVNDGKIDACAKAGISTSALPATPALPALPAVPALPVPVPVAVPSVPQVPQLPQAGATLDACAHAEAPSLDDVTGAAKITAKVGIMGQIMGFLKGLL